MAETLVMRATSLVASAALLTSAGLAALSVSYTVTQIMARDPPPIVSLTPPPMAPPAPTPPVQHAPRIEQPTIDPTPPVVPASAAPNAGPPIAAPPPVITSPHWLQRPHDLGRYYPAPALRREIQGVAELDCLVSAGGQLSCSVISETPANWGFGAAAVRMAQDYRMTPATRDDAPVQGRYHMRVPFQLSSP
jgi:protein TonB